MQPIITLATLAWLAYRCYALIQTEQLTDEIMAEDLRGDSNYTLPPRFFAISAIGHIAISIVFTLVWLLTVHYGFHYIESLAINCERFFDINAILLIEIFLLIITIIASLTLLLYCFTHDNDIQPHWFAYKAVYSDQEIGKNYNNILLITLFCGLLIYHSSHFVMDISKQLKVFKIGQMNVIYQQKCDVKEQPFHTLDN